VEFWNKYYMRLSLRIFPCNKPIANVTPTPFWIKQSEYLLKDIGTSSWCLNFSFLSSELWFWRHQLSVIVHHTYISILCVSIHIGPNHSVMIPYYVTLTSHSCNDILCSLQIKAVTLTIIQDSNIKLQFINVMNTFF